MKQLLFILALFVGVGVKGQVITDTINAPLEIKRGIMPGSGRFLWSGATETEKTLRIIADDGSYAYKHCDTCKWFIYGDAGKVLDILSKELEKERKAHLEMSDNTAKWFAYYNRARWPLKYVSKDGRITNRPAFLEALKEFRNYKYPIE